MTRYIRLWWAFAVNCLSREMQFKANFLFGIVVEATWYATNLVFFDVIFSHVAAIADWTRYEIFVFMGSFYVVDAFMMGFVFSNLTKVPLAINKGELDFTLLKPVNTQFLLSTRYLQPHAFIASLLGVGLIVVGLSGLNITPDITSVLIFILMLASGLVIIYATCMLFQTLAFWLLASQGFEYGYFMFYNFMMKPDSIYRGGVRIVLTYVLPAVVVASWPARAILDKALSWDMVAWSVGAAIIFLYLSHLFFKRGLKRYESASS